MAEIYTFARRSVLDMHGFPYQMKPNSFYVKKAFVARTTNYVAARGSLPFDKSLFLSCWTSWKQTGAVPERVDIQSDNLNYFQSWIIQVCVCR